MGAPLLAIILYSVCTLHICLPCRTAPDQRDRISSGEGLELDAGTLQARTDGGRCGCGRGCVR